MATIPYSQKFILYDYSAALKSKVLLAGEQKVFTGVITGQVSPVHVIGNGSTALSGLPFIETLIISTASNVDLESLRITGNHVKIFNTHTAVITVQTGTSGSPTYENINTKCSSTAFFDGTYWRVEDGAQIGDIKPWHKNFNGGALSLPWGWRAMDGTTISDAESPFNGATFEDLNGDARFLRGSATSGTEQADAFQGHRMNLKVYGGGGATRRYWSAATDDRDSNSLSGDNLGGYTDTFITDGVSGTPRTATETRPINMSVVWIIKIK